MKDGIRTLLTSLFMVAVAVAITLFLASMLYALLPAAGLGLVLAIPLFLLSLRDLWWVSCLVLAAMVLWAFKDDMDLPEFTGPVIRGRDVPRRGRSTRAKPPRRRERQLRESAAGLPAEPPVSRRIGPSRGRDFSARHRRRS